VADEGLRPDQIDDLAPAIRAGLTTDEDENIEAAQRTRQPDGAEMVRQAAEIQYLPGTRIPIPVFVATDDSDTVWLDGVNDDRLQRGAIVSFPEDVVDAMRHGHICIRCHETTESAFPIACSLCGFPMREMQTTAFMAEFDGITNLGPARALQEYHDEMETERLKREHAKKLEEGASPMKGLRRAT
jgi:hypothetical protein